MEPLNEYAVKIFRSTESVNVYFKVQGGKVFRAHSCVLAIRALSLFKRVISESALANQKMSSATIALKVSEGNLRTGPAVFLYTTLDLHNDIVWKESGAIQDILLAAKRFGCTKLKLYAESVLADRHVQVDTAARLLHFAHGNDCALVKETAMDFCVRCMRVVENNHPNGSW